MPKLTTIEYDISCAVEEFWTKERFFPGTKVIAEMTGLSDEEISDALKSDTLQKRFSVMGIDPNVSPAILKGELGKKSTRLSPEQIACVSLLLNPADRRNLTKKLFAIGVLPATYRNWTKSKVFMDYMNEQAEEMFGEAMPLAHQALMQKVMDGDVRAMKLFYEMSGRWNSKQGASDQNFKVLVHRLIEILQVHVKDPVVLQAIAEDVKQIMSPSPVAPVARGELLSDEYAEIKSE